MKKAQDVGTVRERERESYILVKRNVELFDTLTHTSNFLVKKQAKIFSFVSATIVKSKEILKDRLYASIA